MAVRKYDWENGAPLLPHTARKLKVLAEYFAEYLRVRCTRVPQQSRFKLAVVDGFAGAGRYEGGEEGSPLVFLSVVSNTLAEIDARRAADGFHPLHYTVSFVFNDAKREALALLKENAAPLIAAARDRHPNLELMVEFEQERFSSLYPKIRDRLHRNNFGNVLFNLDQCGDVGVDIATVRDILQHFGSAEIFLTFMIKSLLAYLKKNDPTALKKRLAHLELSSSDFADLDGIMSRQEWLGTAERLVFDQWATVAGFVSPFSIHNPDGWRYWLMHFSKSPRARQVYNDVLHANASSQAHFGRAGLNMFNFDPQMDGSLYLFDLDGRARAKAELLEDIPRTISRFGDAISVSEFQQHIYNLTPAHSEDIQGAIFECPDIEIITPKGGTRKSAKAIRADDHLRVASQRSFFSMRWDKP